MATARQGIVTNDTRVRGFEKSWLQIQKKKLAGKGGKTRGEVDQATRNFERNRVLGPYKRANYGKVGRCSGITEVPLRTYLNRISTGIDTSTSPGDTPSPLSPPSASEVGWVGV